MNRIIKFKENLKNKDYKFIIKPYLYCVIILIFCMTSLIRADFKYNDDLGRTAEGYRGWNSFNRYTSTFLSTFIHTSKYLTDISPLPQLLAVAIMALAGVIILYVYKNKKEISFLDIVSILPLALSPYFLECLSYKYDAPYIALSVLVSVFPLLFRNKKYSIYSIITILCTLLMCTTYQASSGIFLMFVVLIFMKNWNTENNFKENFKFLAISTLSFFIGLLLFKFFLMKPFDDYVSSQMFPVEKIVPGFFKQLYKYFSLVLSDFRKEWLLLILTIIISFIYVVVRDSNKKKYIAIPIILIFLIIMGILSFGLYPILIKPTFNPRAMYGFGVFIALMGMVIMDSKKVYVSKLFVCILSYCFIVFAFTYGNALNVQDEYNNFRINLVIEDLNDLEIFQDNKMKYVQIFGTIGQSPILKNMPQDYQMLNRLVPILFREEWYWGGYYFYNYFDLKNITPIYIANLEKYSFTEIKDTMYHTILKNEDLIIIKLK